MGRTGNTHEEGKFLVQINRWLVDKEIASLRGREVFTSRSVYLIENGRKAVLKCFRPILMKFCPIGVIFDSTLA